MLKRLKNLDFHALANPPQYPLPKLFLVTMEKSPDRRKFGNEGKFPPQDAKRMEDKAVFMVNGEP